MTNRISVALKLLAVAISAALLTLFFFCPSFVKWKGLHVEIPTLQTDPTCNRAIATLHQINDPWGDIAISVHQVIKWRLLFPLLWRYLHLPTVLFLAMPFVGCVLALWSAAWIVHQRIPDWISTCLAVMLFAGLSWFFVSTGWLAYFDSWLVLALLTVSFVPSRWAVGAACLLAPWVDERILFALPVCLTVRAIALKRNHRDLLGDLFVVAATSLPYPVVRLVSWLHGETLISDYIARHREIAPKVAITRYLDGLWSGYRTAWILLIAGIWLVWRRVNRGWGLTLGLLTFLTAAGGLFIAQDMSRTLMVTCPVLLLGVLAWQEYDPRRLRPVLEVLVAANLLLPAAHVIWSFRAPIFYLYAEINNYRNPPPIIDAEVYAQRAQDALAKEDLDAAMQAATIALQLEEDHIGARVIRAIVRFKQNDIRGSDADIAAALRQNPDWPDALYVHSAIARARGELMTAKADLQRALEHAPSNWAQRDEAQRQLDSSP